MDVRIRGFSQKLSNKTQVFVGKFNIWALICWLEVYIYIPKKCAKLGLYETYYMQARIIMWYIYNNIYLYIHIYIFILYSTLNTWELHHLSRPNKHTLPLPLCLFVPMICQADINDSPRLPSDWSPLEYELLECHGDQGMVDCCDSMGKFNTVI